MYCGLALIIMLYTRSTTLGSGCYLEVLRGCHKMRVLVFRGVQVTAAPQSAEDYPCVLFHDLLSVVPQSLITPYLLSYIFYLSSYLFLPCLQSVLVLLVLDAGTRAVLTAAR